MKTPVNLKVKSKTGCVHAVDFSDAERDGKGNLVPVYATVCNHNDYHKNYGAGFVHRWPLTDDPITCKRCLLMKKGGRQADANLRKRTKNKMREHLLSKLQYKTFSGEVNKVFLLDENEVNCIADGLTDIALGIEIKKGERPEDSCDHKFDNRHQWCPKCGLRRTTLPGGGIDLKVQP